MAPTSTSPSLPADRRPLVISGPSGVGKGTLFGLLQERHPDTFTLSVSHTTRSPRPGESHGVHYHFVPHADFEALIARDGFVEHAQFSGNRYGTSRQAIRDLEDQGKVVVLDIEMEGVKQIKASGMDARFVFVAPPSEEELEKRLRGRGTEKEESVLKRLDQAKRELEFSKTPGVHDLIVSAPPPHFPSQTISLVACEYLLTVERRQIVNDDLEKAYKQLEDFVYKPTDA